MQAASSEVYKVKSNVFDSFRQIYHNEGWRGLYRVGVVMGFIVLKHGAKCSFVLLGCWSNCTTSSNDSWGNAAFVRLLQTDSP